MTAEQLWELVKGWPDEARPETLQFDGDDWRDCILGTVREADEAADLHALAGLRWLAGSKNTDIVPLLNHRVGGNGWWRIEDAVNDEIVGAMDWQPTILHAVSAAIMAVKGGAA